MIMGWKREPMGEAYFFGKVGGVDRKFIRLLAGVIFPIHGRQRGIVIVLGELYRPSAPMDLTALAAKAGEWKEIEDTLVQYRRDLKYDRLIVDCDEARQMIRRIQGLNYGEIPLLTYTAPRTFAVDGRQRVDSLVAEGRLHLDDIKHVVDAESELGLKALAAAVEWGVEHPAFYGKARRKQPEYKKILGTTGL